MDDPDILLERAKLALGAICKHRWTQVRGSDGMHLASGYKPTCGAPLTRNPSARCSCGREVRFED